MRKTQPISEKTHGEGFRGLWIKPRDQASLLVLAGSLTVMLACYWLYRGGHRGRWIDIDRAEPLTARYLVDINRADWPEIVQLPGLGETLARRIVDNRRRHGPFLDVEEVARVSGIGPRTLERIRPYVIPIPKDTDWAAVENWDTAPLQ